MSEQDPNTDPAPLPVASTPPWLFYAVAGGLGVAFSITLIVLAWNNALHNETRDFAFDGLAAHNTVEANLRSADAALGGFVSFIATRNPPGAGESETDARDVLTAHSAIRGLGLLELGSDGDASRQVAHGAIFESNDFETFREQLRGLLGQEESLIDATRLIADRESGKVYLLREIEHAGLTNRQRRVAAAVIDFATLVGDVDIDPRIGVTVFTAAEGLAGRARVYSHPIMGTDGYIVDTLSEDNVATFDRFSVRLVTERNLLWSDLDKGLIFVALFLAVSVTLLMVALARAKDLQARELFARNQVIESQVRQQTHELSIARDQALEASRVKSDFLASMSHEIRTPLNAIIGMAELLAESRLSNEQEKYVGVFRNAGEALLSLVNDILDLSKIEAGQLALESIEFDVIEIVEQAIDIYALKGDVKGIELIADIGHDVPQHIVGDPGRLRQVVLNLIGNAIKFTEHGYVMVRVMPINHDDNTFGLHFEVADTGIGIPQSKLESVFGSFTQVDSSTTRKYGGTGLGLAISRQLVEMMDGRIWVESVEGAGSIFKFDVELQSAPSRAEDAALFSPDLKAVAASVLQRVSGQALENIFAPAGVRFWFTDELSLLREEIASANERSAPYSVALVEVENDVNQAVEFVRERREAGDGLPIVLLVRPSDVAAAGDAIQGMDAISCVTRPLKRKQLAEAINVARGTITTPDSESSSATDSAEAPLRILLVEDNADNRLLFNAYLKKERCELVEAENGVEAVQHFQQERFDLVLMDVQMPVMDGYTATREIRRWEAEHNKRPAPIVALTANAVKEDKDLSIEAGCNAHLTKPIKKKTLISAIHEYTSAQETGTTTLNS